MEFFSSGSALVPVRVNYVQLDAPIMKGFAFLELATIHGYF